MSLIGRLRLWGRAGYVILTWGIVALVWMQVFYAGLAVLASPGYWVSHTLTGHMFSPLIVALFILGLVGRLPTRWTLFSVGLFGIYSLQYVFLHLPPDQLSAIRGFHAANALVMLLVTLYIARSSFRVVVDESHVNPKVFSAIIVGVVTICLALLVRWVAP